MVTCAWLVVEPRRSGRLMNRGLWIFGRSAKLAGLYIAKRPDNGNMFLTIFSCIWKSYVGWVEGENGG
uniref:Uncharacterized protein n=1 Tax=Cannabis sativa TaxID=3483 RepID=A0A803R6F4_CANSA